MLKWRGGPICSIQALRASGLEVQPTLRRAIYLITYRSGVVAYGLRYPSALNSPALWLVSHMLSSICTVPKYRTYLARKCRTPYYCSLCVPAALDSIYSSPQANYYVLVMARKSVSCIETGKCPVLMAVGCRVVLVHLPDRDRSVAGARPGLDLSCWCLTRCMCSLRVFLDKISIDRMFSSDRPF